MATASQLARLEGLQAPVKELAKQLIDRAVKAGISVTVIEGHRTPERQAELYAAGAATHAKPWWSFHNYGTAFDIAPTKLLRKKDWDPDNPLWDKLGAIGESLGFEWGGRWKGIKDKPHFEYHPGLHISEVVAHFKKTGEVLLSKVLSPPIAVALAGAVIFGVYHISKRLKL